MMRMVSWAVGWSSVVWMVMILALHPPAMADPTMPVTAPQVTEQAPAAEAVAPEGDTAPQATEPLPAAEAVAPEGDTAPQVTEQLPYADEATVPASEAPLPALQGATPKPVNGNPSLFRAVFDHFETAFTFSTGVRKDDFQWSIAGNSAGANPNILSELTWSDVDSYQLTLANRTLFKRHLYLRGELNYALVQNGRIQDSDFREDDRGDEYSRSYSDCSGDQLWDLSLAAGHPLFFLQDRLLVAPLFGLSYHKQNFRITDGEQVTTWAGGPSLGTLEGLDSTYRSTWKGPWIGCDVRYRTADGDAGGNLPMEFGLSVELHYADYTGEANWNLRPDFKHPKSFEHDAQGHGFALAGEWLIGLGNQWDFVFRTTYQYWQTGDGVDRVYNSDGTTVETRLNEVAWRNFSFMVGANFHF